MYKYLCILLLLLFVLIWKLVIVNIILILIVYVQIATTPELLLDETILVGKSETVASL